MTETALKPCPFCGSAPTIFQREHSAITHVPLAWIVQCTGCTAETCSEHLQWAIDYWNRRPNPETQAVATERLDLGNLRVVVECMTCTGKLPHGCPNCKGLDFCVKRHAQKTLDKLEAYRDKQK